VRTGGRQKGTPNKKTQEANELAQKLGVDPFAILLHFSAGNWKALGYKSQTEVRYSQAGEPYEVLVIQPDMRISAAKEAVKYIRPQLKAIEHKGDITLTQSFVIEKTYEADRKAD
jgi:hypothetical protein